jgi:hypothetical protein
MSTFGPPLLSPSLHEDIFANPGADPMLDLVKRTLGAGRVAAESASKATVAVHSDQTLSEGAAHVRSDALATQIVTPALKQLDSATAQLDGEIATLEKRLKGPAPPPPVQASEIRAALRGLNTEALNTALKEHDDAVIGACLDGALMLSNLSALERENLRIRWASDRLHAEVARLTELR